MFWPSLMMSSLNEVHTNTPHSNELSTTFLLCTVYVRWSQINLKQNTTYINCIAEFVVVVPHPPESLS